MITPALPTDAAMRNATCASIVYELAYYVDWRMRQERDKHYTQYDADPETGARRQYYSHDFMSHGEWTCGVLVDYGVLIGKNPYFRPVMSLDKIRQSDFAELESLHNYLHCMFTLEQVLGFHTPHSERLPLERLSSSFPERIAAADDIFIIRDSDWIAFDWERYRDKVLTRWRQTLNRSIRRNSESA